MAKHRLDNAWSARRQARAELKTAPQPTTVARLAARLALIEQVLGLAPQVADKPGKATKTSKPGGAA